MLVVGGIVTGPSIVSCYNDAAGLGNCVADKLADAGIVPKSVAVVTPQAAAPEPAAEVTKPAEPANTMAAVPDAEPTLPAASAAPAVTLVRVEPDGSMVLGGTAAPNAEIEVFLNDSSFGKTKAEASGDWVMIPDGPLPTGSTKLTVGTAGGERGGQIYTITVAPDHSTTPVVVASLPGAADQVLQGAETPAETDVAAAETPAPATETEAAATETPSPTTETEVAVTEPPAPATTEPAPPAEETQVAVAETPAVEPTPDVATRALEPGAGTAAETTEPTTTTPPAEQQTAVAAVEPETITTPEPPVTPVPLVTPTIDAIEIDGTKNFFAGAGTEGAAVKLFVDDVHIADSEVKDGRWLVEAENVLTKKEQRVRIEVQPVGSTDVSRAEINFMVEAPATEVATAEPSPIGQSAEGADIAVPPTPIEGSPVPDVPPPEPPVAAIGEIAVASAEPPALPDVTPSPQVEGSPVLAAVPPPPPQDVAVADTTAPASEQPTAVTTEPPRNIDAAVEPQVEERPEQPAVAAVEPSPTTEAEQAAAAEKPAQTETEVAASTTTAVNEPSRPETTQEAVVEPQPEPEPEPVLEAAVTPPAEPEPATTEAEAEVPTLVAVPVGDPELARFSSGKAIIRTGDNLWTIARRVYGAGVKWSMIWEANSELIRNPHWIYPGQVFDLPAEQVKAQ